MLPVKSSSLIFARLLKHIPQEFSDSPITYPRQDHGADFSRIGFAVGQAVFVHVSGGHLAEEDFKIGNLYGPNNFAQDVKTAFLDHGSSAGGIVKRGEDGRLINVLAGDRAQVIHLPDDIWVRQVNAVPAGLLHARVRLVNIAQGDIDVRLVTYHPAGADGRKIWLASNLSPRQNRGERP